MRFLNQLYSMIYPCSWSPGYLRFGKLVLCLTVSLEMLISDPNKSLVEILAHKNNRSEFNVTYLPVINRLLKGQTKRKEEILVHEFQEIVSTIIMLESPLSIISLSRFIRLPKEHIDRRLDLLHSVLDISKDPTQPVRLFYLSFRDYLLDHETREKIPFRLDSKEMHYKLTVKCLSVCESLRKNICTLPSDGTYRAEIDRRKIDDYVPAALQYACQYWAHHLVQCRNLNNVEAMSLLGLMSEILSILDTLQTGIFGNESCSILDFLHDAKRFVMKNRQIADEAPLQIYCAGLVFAPRTAIIRREFQSELPSWICQFPQTVRLWDAATGGLQQTLKGHVGSVRSVAFSPDGRLLASGSLDQAVRLWDTVTGALQQTIEYNSGWVPIRYSQRYSSSAPSVAFSPDGRLLASGSYNQRVRLWDTATGAIQQTLKGHSGSDLSAAFSPGRWMVVPGSLDQTVRLRDTGPGILQETEDHSGSVTSMAFSPDGRLLASCFLDQTVWLWDIATGALQKTLKSNGIVTELQFSQDGSYLITNLGTLDVQSGHENHASNSTNRNPAIFIQQGQWINLNGKNALWLPPEFQPSCSATSGN
ncbi:uncharacterized protein N7458_004396 [Penicillium daleae]|uniref:Vegetative incompatibility protein HET-E-1 n=1 Tax=Penicillium daleae TaxID=63821 RepID=A0AAD6C7T9_9EURO|nr:uncharacterized protein N7458_004396 [Penicillium daleae]KAJ5453440.1 hypothetical protein N7458_004396 [Penicillium daleae]